MNITVHIFVSTLMSFAVCRPTNDQLVGQFNTLLSQPGWQYMDISVSKKYKGSRKGKQLQLKDNERADDDQMAFITASELLEDNIQGDPAVTTRNLSIKYKQILIVLQCKYAEVTMVYRSLIQKLIDTCRLEMRTLSTYTYHTCFDLLLSKVSYISVTFRYMRDALRFFETMTPTTYISHCVVQKSLSSLEAFTRHVSEETNHGLNKCQCDGTKYVAAKQELDRFLQNFIELTKKNSDFLTNYCLTPLQVNTPEILTDKFVEKAISNISSLPSEETIVDYIGHEIDAFSGHIIKRWFYRLGFIYDSTKNPVEVTFNTDILL